MTRPDSNAEVQAAYGAWVRDQPDGDHALWSELPSAEQDGWRRAVRLIAVLGLEED